MLRKGIHKTIETDLTAKEMAFTVLDVAKYKNFVPYCTHSKILEKKENLIIAEITISFAIFKINYISEIKFFGDEEYFEIEVTESSKHNDKKVFNHLKNIWKFKKNGNFMEIEFNVEFHIKNKVLHAVAEKSLNIVSEKILKVFLHQILKHKF